MSAKHGRYYNMYEKRKTYDIEDVVSIVIKVLVIFAAIAAAVVTAIKIYEKIQTRRMLALCDFDECCDDNFVCDECECEDCDKGITVEEVTEKEINPTEN